ncbi:pyrroline-5-carboxylate reductase [Metabacillus malikii]|uniref:Pyrroline-5-carboxylate reductase n=1 Tax=Metabacillus malikii TaxID=1504265 RepID=A0ABT9Z9K6_9BACI|nr:pyrroline-5-carboxylate reductase [Metabacillus malikii]MDQ0228931.1 pyrroline-5-carboxylate reductase [Metabacillus malikii]
MTKSILFIGAGRMAEAIIAGLKNKQDIHSFSQLYISNRNNKNRLNYLKEKYDVEIMDDWERDINNIDIVFLALPPDGHEAILKKLKPILRNQFVITIAAGIGPEFLEAGLEKNTAVAWMMPNTAAEVGHSITLFTFGHHVNREQKKDMQVILDSIGKSVECTESQIHKLTAVTGSAPAFLYLFIEFLINKTENLGVPTTISSLLVNEMVIGSIEMIKTGIRPSELREQVTTPGGATAEGLKVLVKGGLEELITEAIDATNRKANGK